MYQVLASGLYIAIYELNLVFGSTRILILVMFKLKHDNPRHRRSHIEQGRLDCTDV